MKKVVLMFLLASIGFISFAQSYNEVKNDILLRRYEEAKTALDKTLANPKLKDKDKLEGAYWTYVVDTYLAADSATAAKHPGMDSIALEALYAYEQKDTSLKTMRENLESNSLRDIDVLKAISFNNGITRFSGQNWQGSYSAFIMANKIDEFRLRHGFVANNYIDTNLTLFTGYAAQNTGNLAGAADSYKKLIDRNIVIESKDFENSIYYYLLGYYMRNSQTDNFTKYAATVKSIVPKYAAKVDQMAMQNMTSNASITELMTKYKQESSGNLTEAQFASYADAFAQPDKAELAKLDSATQLQVRLAAAEAYSKAYYIASANPAKDKSAGATDFTGIYAYNAAILYTNVYQELADRFYALKGADAKLKAAREATEKMEHQYADSAIVWATNAYNTFKAKGADMSKREINYTKTAVQNLSNIYGWKRDRAQGVNPKDYDKFDALYKQFDAETDKYDNLYKQKTN